MIPSRHPGGANKGKKYPAEPLTPGEVTAIIGQCSARSATGIRNRALLTLLYRSGLRISELLALRSSDVNFAAHSIRLLDTKGDEAADARLPPERRRRAVCAGSTTAAITASAGPLFCTLDGGPMSAQYVGMMLKRLAGTGRDREAGPPARPAPHVRRRAATPAWTSLSVISKLLGHSSASPMTARYLDHLTNHQAVTALQAVDAAAAGCLTRSSPEQALLLIPRALQRRQVLDRLPVVRSA